VKLDADLSFAPDYFERLLRKFEEDPSLGVGGGMLYQARPHGLVLERAPLWHVRGATKVYRQECFSQIGGVEECLGWDTIDELRAEMNGWGTRSFEDVTAVHHRPTSSVGGLVRGTARLGRGSYYLGSDPVFMVARSVRRMLHPPYVIGGLAMFAGYCDAWLRGSSRYEDEELMSYLRGQQRRRLTLRKRIPDASPRVAEGSRSRGDHV